MSVMYSSFVYVSSVYMCLCVAFICMSPPCVCMPSPCVCRKDVPFPSMCMSFVFPLMDMSTPYLCLLRVFDAFPSVCMSPLCIRPLLLCVYVHCPLPLRLYVLIPSVYMFSSPPCVSLCHLFLRVCPLPLHLYVLIPSVCMFSPCICGVYVHPCLSPSYISCTLPYICIHHSVCTLHASVSMRLFLIGLVALPPHKVYFHIQWGRTFLSGIPLKPAKALLGV